MPFEKIIDGKTKVARIATSRATRAYQFADCKAAMIRPTLSGEKNSAGEIVPAFICTKPSMLFWLRDIAPNSCRISGGGGFIAAS